MARWSFLLGLCPAVGVLAPAWADEALSNGTTSAVAGSTETHILYSTGRDWLFDSGTNPNGSGRNVSGVNVAQGWIVFQPFIVPEPGWIVTTTGTDGWNVQDPLGLGMLGTLLPDINGQPNEAQPIASNTFYLGNNAFQSNWRDRPFNVTLLPGKYWMKWSDNKDPNHWSAIYYNVAGLPSFSRRISDGAIFNAPPTALRIAGEVIPEPGTLSLFMVLAGALLRRR